jgi:hypothetical protein
MGLLFLWGIAVRFNTLYNTLKGRRKPSVRIKFLRLVF